MDRQEAVGLVFAKLAADDRLQTLTGPTSAILLLIDSLAELLVDTYRVGWNGAVSGIVDDVLMGRPVSFPEDTTDRIDWLRGKRLGNPDADLEKHDQV